jgi:tetratricopeptide (TPR) repeat protein
MTLAALVLMVVPQVFLSPPAARGQAGAENPDAEAFQERDRLRKETQRLRREGTTAEAIAAAEALLAIERKLRPAESADVAGALGLLAELHAEREDFAAALAARREALEIQRKRRGASDWRVIDARVALEDVECLAGMDWEQRARLAEAELLNRTVEELYQAGKYADAVPWAHQALDIHKAVLGQRHPGTAQSLHSLAWLLQAQGDYAAAKPLYEQALDIRKAVLGERHPSTASNLAWLANLRQAQGDYAGARPLYEQALDICKAVHGERHSDTAQSLNNLAELL